MQASYIIYNFLLGALRRKSRHFSYLRCFHLIWSHTIYLDHCLNIKSIQCLKLVPFVEFSITFVSMTGGKLLISCRMLALSWVKLRELLAYSLLMTKRKVSRRKLHWIEASNICHI